MVINQAYASLTHTLEMKRKRTDGAMDGAINGATDRWLAAVSEVSKKKRKKIVFIIIIIILLIKHYNIVIF